MLSLIICSRHSDISLALKENIQSSIGVEYELIIIDNSRNEYSIFSAYNEGVRRARNPYLCFMHEDILYHTQNWGKSVIEYLNDERVGIIGVGGSHYLSKYPLVSYTNYEIERTKFYTYKILQGYWENQVYKTRLDYHVCCKEPIYAAFIDGLWFCIRADLFKKTIDPVKFDNRKFNGFHFYDLDICMQVNKLNLRIQIVTNILIEHSSAGCFNSDWNKNSFIFSNKWKDDLPLSKGINLTKEEIKMIEFEQFSSYIQQNINIREQLQDELKAMQSSKAYRLGKFLLKPFQWVKSF
jgi:hypothetical protein